MVKVVFFCSWTYAHLLGKLARERRDELARPLRPSFLGGRRATLQSEQRARLALDSSNE